MNCHDEPLVSKIAELYEKISRLESLKPSKDVNTLFTELVLTCLPISPVDVNKLCKQMQDIRCKLIKLCGEAEGLLEAHYSTVLGSYENPLHHLDIFPYFSNYIKLSQLEFDILNQHSSHVPKRIAFLGSGPLPLTSICLATYHLKNTSFHNYDIYSSANSMAARLVSSDPELSGRMFFHTTDIMDVTDELKDYDVVYLAALVGMDKESKLKAIEHLTKHMAPGALLMLRSAHSARAFLYPIVDADDLQGFEVLQVFHPTDDVVNSVVIARKIYSPPFCSFHHEIVPMPMRMAGCKCSDQLQALINPLSHGSMIEELAINHERC